DIPVMLKIFGGAGKEISLEKREKSKDNPPSPSTTLSGPVTSLLLIDQSDPVSRIIDRYWDISATGISANVTLSYRAEENTIDPVLRTGALVTKYWNGSTWNDLVSNGTGVTTGIGTVSITGTNSFSSWILASNSINPLPINLLSFRATPVGNKVKLNWETATEKNNEYFTIERSQDAKNFSDIAIVKGAGDSNIILKYEHWDSNPLNGISYYRLKQTDYDGKFSYSTIASVNRSGSNANLEIHSISPNPFINNFDISFSNPTSEAVEFELINLQGQKVYNDKLVAEAGDNYYRFNKGDELPAGTYIALIRSSGSTTTKKIIKK
ncbi:MAG: T9SS type A sorting domain-containing protein, partial [Bacteroidia bacterium]